MGGYILIQWRGSLKLSKIVKQPIETKSLQDFYSILYYLYKNLRIANLNN